MNQDTKYLKKLRWSLRCAEWVLLILLILLYAFDPNSTTTQLIHCVGFNLLFFALSFILPLDRPLWQRRVYVALEGSLIVTAISTGLELTFLLYYLLIKSCFLLSRRDVIIAVIAGGLSCAVGISWNYDSLSISQLQQFTGIAAPSSLPIVLFYLLIYYMFIATFVMLLGFLIISERNSRHRAEALAQEVETLGANLERVRIAREIHDSLGHSLTSLGIQLEVAQKLRDRNLEQSFVSVDNAALLATQCLQDVRQLVQTMRRSGFNLDEAIQELMDQLRQQDIEIHSDLRLPPLPLQTSHQIYCILKEGLINIQKHAHPSLITLTGATSINLIILILQDNGCGFDPNQPLKGYGLQGMQERVELLGGTLKINAALRKGTQLEVKIPYDSSACCR